MSDVDKRYMDKNKHAVRKKSGAFPQPVGSRQKSMTKQGETIGTLEARAGDIARGKIKEKVRHAVQDVKGWVKRD